MHVTAQFALKSWWKGQINLAHGTKTEYIKKKLQQKRVDQKKVWVIVCEVKAIREEEVKLREKDFLKQVGFKPGEKE